MVKKNDCSMNNPFKYPGFRILTVFFDEEGRVADFKVKVRPETTADLALRLIKV